MQPPVYFSGGLSVYRGERGFEYAFVMAHSVIHL